MKKYSLPVVPERKKYQYANEDDFAGDPFLAMLRRETGEDLLEISQHEGKWEVSKFSIAINGRDFRSALDEMSQWYEFILHGDHVAEAVPKGFSKATGIQAVCQHIGIAHQDTYAFGDSSNDLEMLKYVAHGVAMGDGMEEAKAAADYVTNGIHEDGIYNGCKRLGLI